MSAAREDVLSVIETAIRAFLHAKLWGTLRNRAVAVKILYVFE